jgi:hypothetical protein
MTAVSSLMTRTQSMSPVKAVTTKVCRASILPCTAVDALRVAT